MAPIQPKESNGNENAKPIDSTTSVCGEVFVIPEWINEENFIGVLEENFKGFKKILSFEAAKTAGAGENYASIIVRVKTKFELEDGSTKDAAFIIKIVPQDDNGAEMVSEMGCFPKESLMYGTYLSEFEQMYADAGKNIKFGPKFYTFKKNPGFPYILLKDLSPSGFKNANRLEGLDKEHTESVLKMMAELHAASAVRHATKGEYEESFKNFMTNDDKRIEFDEMVKPFIKLIKNSYSKSDGVAKYLPIMAPYLDNMMDIYVEMGKQKPNVFCVVVHGDLWANNIMFRYDDEGKRKQTMFVDFQMSRYTSPAIDLLNFLLSSTCLDIKLNYFDDFVKLYHDNLIENLKLLNYSRKAPSLKQLHIDMLGYSSMAFNTVTGVLAAALLDPSEAATIDNYFQEGEESMNFKRQLYENPRYIKQLEVILPWMYKRGYLDDN